MEAKINRRRVVGTVRFVACALIPVAVFAGAFVLLRRTNVDTAAQPAFTDEEQVNQIVDALRLYAQAFKGRFPDVERFHGDELIAAVSAELQLPAMAGHSPRWGFSHLTVLQRSDPSFRYYGSEVRLGQSDRILVHWRGAAGKHRVIFGDLSHREVDDLALTTLRSPWRSAALRCVVRVAGNGSGVVVSPDGLILTANHVLPPDGDSVEIQFAGGASARAKVLQRSKRLDVAALRMSVDSPIPFIELAPSAGGGAQAAWVIGYPNGRREPVIRKVAVKQIVLGELITTFNQVSGGDSGGAMLDANGRLIGVILGPADASRTTLRSAYSPALRDEISILGKPSKTQ